MLLAQDRCQKQRLEVISTSGSHFVNGRRETTTPDIFPRKFSYVSSQEGEKEGGTPEASMLHIARMDYPEQVCMDFINGVEQCSYQTQD